MSKKEKRGITYIMADYKGREWMDNFLSEAEVYGQCFTESARTTAFLLGRRDAGLRCLAQIDAHCPELLLHMQREARERRQQADNRAAKNLEAKDDGRAADSRDD